MPEHQIQPEALRNAIFAATKFWWCCELATLGVSIAITLIDAIIMYVPVGTACIVAFLTVIAWLFNLRWDRLNNLAQRLSRMCDFYTAFGWPVPVEEMATIRKATPSRIKGTASALPVDQDYFASKLEPGISRAAENLRETAFWSAALATRSAWISAFAGVGGVVVAIIILLIGIKGASTDKTRDSLAIVAMGVLTAGSSLGIWTMCWKYYQFGKDSESAVVSANRMLELNQQNERPVIIAWGDYQIVRASSPPISNMLYRQMHDEIDNDYRSTYGADQSKLARK